MADDARPESHGDSPDASSEPPSRRRPMPFPREGATGDANLDQLLATGPSTSTLIAPDPARPPTKHRSELPPGRSLGDIVGDAVGGAVPKPVRNTLQAVGELYTMAAASAYGLADDLIRGKFKFTEFVERSWFLVSVTLLPAILVSIPLGVAIALQVGALAAQIGASSFVGAADAIGVLREASPIVTALLLAGVGGSAVCAELGARTIREEIDAMVVLGLNPLRRLVAPLMLAGVVVAAFLNFVVVFVSIISAYLFDLAALHGTKGSFFGSFTQFATTADFITSEIKATIFGITAVLIAAYKGLSAKRGPTGVGEAVNQSVVITGIVLFGLNLIITEIFFAIVPQRTF